MTLGLLNAYHFDTTAGNYQEAYLPMCLNYLQAVLPGIDIKTYAVARGEFPQSVEECDSWFITGSPKSAYEDDVWIQQLKAFICDCDVKKIKLIGICFGHQLIAQALSGNVEKAKGGWGVGVKSMSIGKYKSWMQPEKTQCKLLYSHQDQVVQLPESAQLLATSDYCPHQMFSIGEHIYSMQGHPEFTADYALARMNSRKQLLGELVYSVGVGSLSNSPDHLIVGEWINRFLKT